MTYHLLQEQISCRHVTILRTERFGAQMKQKRPCRSMVVLSVCVLCVQEAKKFPSENAL